MDAFGVTARVEVRPPQWVDQTGLGYTYLGPVAGDKQQVDLDATRTVWTDWTFSGAYIYRQPVIGPCPYIYEGTHGESRSASRRSRAGRTIRSGWIGTTARRTSSA